MEQKADIIVTDWGLPEEKISEVMRSYLNFESFNIQKVLRQLVYSKSTLAKELNETIKQGNILSPLLLEKVILDFTRENKNSFFFEKYPRTFDQSKSLLVLLKENNIELKSIWHFKITDPTAYRNNFFKTKSIKQKIQKYGFSESAKT